jgi:hypothetical protein
MGVRWVVMGVCVMDVLCSFYMRRNADGKTVQGGDLLIPSLGELIGGSMRESDYNKMGQVMLERKMYKRVDGRPVDEALHRQVLSRLASVRPMVTIPNPTTATATAATVPVVPTASVAAPTAAATTVVAPAAVATTVVAPAAATGGPAAFFSVVDAVCSELGLHFGPLTKYLALRKNAAVSTGGFGLGFERLVTICTTNESGGNIREASVFPVAVGELSL